MKKIMFALMLTMLLCFAGQVFAQNGTATIKFSWEHVVPSDMKEYTIYQLDQSGGIHQGDVFVIPYVDGTVPPFMSEQPVVLPCDTPTDMCWVITAKDLKLNESNDSDEACATITADCSPEAPSVFTVEFPVVPATTTTTP